MTSTARLNTFIATLSLSVMLSAPAFAMGPRCSEIFTEKISTEQINQAIAELAALRVDLDQTKAQGITSIARGVLAQKFEIQQKLILQYLEKYQVMTHTQFFEKMREEISNIQNQKLPQNDSNLRALQKQQEELHFLDKGLTANRVEPGTFRIWGYPEGLSSKIKITKPYELMATPTTQYVWRRVVELASQHSPGKYELDADPSYFKNESNPVETVTHVTVTAWLQALNELSVAGEPALSQLIFGHKQGDTYRLPTEAEWAMVAQERGNLDISAIDANEYGWFRKDSNGQTHPVGQKKPVVLDGHKFYDMFGNVNEWTSDLSDRRNSYLPRGKDPKGLNERNSEYTSYVIRGGGYIDAQINPGAGLREVKGRNERRYDIGFRIVRNVPEVPVEKKNFWQKLAEKLRR